jgi:cystathionine beta-lyase
MATSTSLVSGSENAEDHRPDPGLANLSLSSKTIHADDYLNKGRDVAPPLHVSTTFRYNRDPDQLKAHRKEDVRSTHNAIAKSTDLCEAR